MTAVDLPEEPPVGTTLTAPRMTNLIVRMDGGWYIIHPDGYLLVPGAPGAKWPEVVRTLTEYGGILTVTIEHQVTYRSHGMAEDETDIVIDGFKTRPQIDVWREKMNDAIGIRITGIRSQRVTRSAWTDEPLEDPT